MAQYTQRLKNQAVARRVGFLWVSKTPEAKVRRAGAKTSSRLTGAVLPFPPLYGDQTRCALPTLLSYPGPYVSYPGLGCLLSWVLPMKFS